MAQRFGVELRILNPGAGATFHPKRGLSRTGKSIRAVIGPANLTGGLASNLEAAVDLEGRRGDEPLDRAWTWAEALWGDPRVTTWQPGATADATAETFEPELFAHPQAAVALDPVFRTLGRTPRANRVTDLSRVEVQVETARSARMRGGSASIPA